MKKFLFALFLGPRGNVVDSSVPVNRLVHFKLSVPQ